jgi:GTPase
MKFCKENEYNSIEYKRHISFLTKDKLERYATQMNYRLFNGKGNAIYLIGIDDNGEIVGLSYKKLLESIRNLISICKIIDATYKKIIIISNHNNFFSIVKIHSQKKEYTEPKYICFDYM